MDSHSEKPHSPHSPSDHYSVDEMMERLKRNDQQKSSNNQDQEGELITRPDGSQVIKVRKHKRRSKQHAKKTNRKTNPRTNPKTKWRILWSMVVVLAILIGGMMFIIAKYNGRSFKEKTESTISALTGAESTKLVQLRVTPLSALASKADLTWKNDTFYQSANFSKIRADIMATSFLSRNWTGEELVAQQGTVHLQAPLADAEKSDPPIVSRYRFGTLRCNNLNILFGPEKTAPAINGVQASMRKGNDDSHQLIFNDGLVNIPNWPALKISSGILTMNSTNTEIEARLEAGDNLKGEILIQGIIPNNTSRTVVLDAHSKNFPVEELLGKGLGRFIQGNINSDTGTLSYDYKKKSSGALSFIMPFNSVELYISELPMLSDLTELTGDTQYRRPVLSHCRGTIMRTFAGVSLDHLHLISSRLINLQGNISVSREGQLSGELLVGIPARLFNKNRPAPAIFSTPHNGYISTKVTLSGSIHNPHDDLNERLRASNLDKQSLPPASNNTGLLKPLTPMEKVQQEARQKEKDFEELTR